jgi:hypothetical protein
MNSRTITIFLSITIFSACSKVPFRVIQEDEMIHLLTDIHLAEAMMDNDSQMFADSAGKANLFRSIFEKHHTTKAEFDTSLVWYASHLDIYMDVYKRVSDGLAMMNDTFIARRERLREQEAQPECIWKADSMIVLKPTFYANLYTFRVDTDAYFSPHDMYALHVFALGVNAHNRPQVTFSWESQDTLLTNRSEILHDGQQIFYLTALPGKTTASLYGSIHLPVKETSGISLFISDIFIVRHREGYHPKLKTGVHPDSIPQ